MTYLHYFAGSSALTALRENGLAPGHLQAMLGAATGPRWLGWAALDQAVAASGLLTAQRDGTRLLMRGGSAGAWRMAALCSPEPIPKHRALAERYLSTKPRPGQSPHELSALYRAVLDELFTADAARVLSHPERELEIVVARVAPFLQRTDAWSRLAFGVAALGGTLAPRRDPPGTEKLVLRGAPNGSRALAASSLVPALLASGSVPSYMAPVTIPGAPQGLYLDGGLVEYHVGHDTLAQGTALMIHHSREIKARWFDKLVPWAPEPAASMKHLLLLVPTREYLRRLPGHALPSRDDFFRYADNQAQRIERWRAAVSTSELLAEQFERDLSSGRIIDSLIPLGGSRGSVRATPRA